MFHYAAICHGSMRHMNKFWITVLLPLLFMKWALSIRFIPERTEITYANEKYIYNATAYIVRYGRKSTYYYNLDLGIKHTWGNNITIHLAFFEAQDNHFKRTFVEFHLKFCDMLQNDPYFGVMLRRVLSKYGISCPMPPGMYHLMNVTLPSDDFPNIMPFQKGKVDMTYSQLPSQDIILQEYIIFSIKN